MKTEKIEGNTLISEFMGQKFYAYKGNHSYKKGFKSYKKCEDFILKNKLEGYAPEIGWKMGLGKYDSSWDSLIPVVEKIEDMKIMMEITLSTVNVFSSLNGFDDFYVKGKTKKAAVWLAVVEILKWCNQNNNQ